MDKGLEIEVWKPCSGFTSHYEVSTRGGVRRLQKDKYLTQKMKKYGSSRMYYTVNLSVKGRVVTKDVHRLIAETFLSCGKEKVVMHINGDTSDNSVTNLECVTYSQNAIRCQSYKNAVQAQPISVLGSFGTLQFDTIADAAKWVKSNGLSKDKKKALWHFMASHGAPKITNSDAKTKQTNSN